MLVLLFADQIGEQAVLRGFLTTDLLWVRMLTSIAAPICMGCLYACLCTGPRVSVSHTACWDTG